MTNGTIVKLYNGITLTTRTRNSSSLVEYIAATHETVTKIMPVSSRHDTFIQLD